MYVLEVEGGAGRWPAFRAPGEKDAEYSLSSIHSEVPLLQNPQETANKNLKMTNCLKPPLMNALCEANGTFAINLLKMLAEEDHSRHVFFSLLSLSFVLTMVLMGAEGNTVAQMSQALCLNEGGDVHQGLQSFLREVSTPGPQSLLTTANRLFGEKTCDFLPKLKCLRTGDGQRMGANCQAHDIRKQVFMRNPARSSIRLTWRSFAEDTKECRKHIDDWMMEKTEGCRSWDSTKE
ncbi:serpin B8 isoform X2 [Bubalus bubalis]|uniref:serpin B8 isoform X2 n=1 Tax=Bubalus bubalis TaxID=89462 RepID=UPI001E1B91E1|nr:serpin B8 isoform X2 [Bubalus bubalis]